MVTNCDLKIVMPQKSESPVAVEQIDGMIRTIRGVRVMLDRDLAKIYGVPTFRFNEATNAIAIGSDGFHVPAYTRGVRFLDIAKCDVKNRSRWPAHSPLRVY